MPLTGRLAGPPAGEDLTGGKMVGYDLLLSQPRMESHDVDLDRRKILLIGNCDCPWSMWGVATVPMVFVP